MKNKIVQIHIPKTGGTWLHNQLKMHIPDLYQLHDSQDVWHTGLSSISHLHTHRYPEYAFSQRVIQPWKKPTISWPDTPQLDAAVKVSICRNPFDHLVSLYYAEDGAGLCQFNKIHRFTSFEEFIKHFCDPDFPFTERIGDLRYFLYYQMFNNSGCCPVQVIIRNECLHSGASRAISEWKNERVVLSKERENVSKSRKKKDYRSYYTDELRELVTTKCMAELTLFEYHFDGPANESEFINPDSLFYGPHYPVAGKNLSRDVIRTHTLMLNSCLPLYASQVRTIHHITPDVFCVTADDGGVKPLSDLHLSDPQRPIIHHRGNDGDPKPMMDAIQVAFNINMKHMTAYRMLSPGFTVGYPPQSPDHPMITTPAFYKNDYAFVG